MSQPSPLTIDRIRGSYTPRSALHSSTSASPRPSRPRVQQQHSQRTIRLSDIQKRKAPRKQQKEAKHSSRTELGSFWVWLKTILDDVTVKAASQSSHNDLGLKAPIVQGSSSAQTFHSSEARRPGKSATPLKQMRTREAQQAARQDQLDHEAHHHSLWAEIIYIYKSLRENTAKKKAEREGHARQRARQEKPNIQLLRGLDAVLEEEQAMPERRPTPFPLGSPSSRLSPRIKDIAPELVSVVASHPDLAFSKTKGEVTKHDVKITHLPSAHHSVEIMRDTADNSKFREEIEVDYKKKSSHITTFGDFMRKPSEPSERLARLPPYIPNPVAPRENPPTVAKSRHQRNGTEWTFTIPGIDDQLARISTPIIPNLQSQKAIEEERESQASNDPQECILCGTLNSPKTHYNQQGLWLCTACRSPTSAKELPPPPAVPPKTTPAQHKSRSGSSSSKEEPSTEKHENMVITNDLCEYRKRFPQSFGDVRS